MLYKFGCTSENRQSFNWRQSQKIRGIRLTVIIPEFPGRIPRSSDTMDLHYDGECCIQMHINILSLSRPGTQLFFVKFSVTVCVAIRGVSFM